MVASTLNLASNVGGVLKFTHVVNNDTTLRSVHSPDQVQYLFSFSLIAHTQ